VLGDDPESPHGHGGKEEGSKEEDKFDKSGKVSCKEKTPIPKQTSGQKNSTIRRALLCWEDSQNKTKWGCTEVPNYVSLLHAMELNEEEEMMMLGKPEEDEELVPEEWIYSTENSNEGGGGKVVIRTITAIVKKKGFW
jgi:hypothetical protein